MRLFFVILFTAILFPALAQQEFKKEIVGTLNRKIFLHDNELKLWFVTEYNSYQPIDSCIQKLKSSLSGKKIVVVLGTWCSDSQREFPRLLKVLDAAQFPQKQLKIYGINKPKSLPAHLISRYSITNVPTIIVFDKNGTETGRIIEAVRVSMEYDLLWF